MWKYIVIWCLVTEGLPDPSYDEFGRMDLEQSTTEILKYEQKRKAFSSKNDALEFMEKASKENKRPTYNHYYGVAQVPGIDSVRIDSVYVKPRPL